MQNIPSVDLRDFLSDDPKRKQKFVNEIGSAFEDITARVYLYERLGDLGLIKK